MCFEPIVSNGNSRNNTQEADGCCCISQFKTLCREIAARNSTRRKGKQDGSPLK
jgi:hypothetical protein